MSVTPPQRLLTVEEAGAMLRKSAEAMRYFLRKTDCPIPVQRIGGRVMVRLSDVEALAGGNLSEKGSDRYAEGFRDGYREALADMRSALNKIDK